jgi:hypothetical protein
MKMEETMGEGVPLRWEIKRLFEGFDVGSWLTLLRRLRAAVKVTSA